MSAQIVQRWGNLVGASGPRAELGWARLGWVVLYGAKGMARSVLGRDRVVEVHAQLRDE